MSLRLVPPLGRARDLARWLWGALTVVACFAVAGLAVGAFVGCLKLVIRLVGR